MTTPGLFDPGPYQVPDVTRSAETPNPVSADRRRTQRQADAIAQGGHPLGLVDRRVQVHPDANGSTATRDNADARPLRCGTCRFRQHVLPGRNSYPKCVWKPDDYRPGLAPPRCSRGPGTDVRAWWPACTDWQPAAADGTP